ncbi:AAA family ATPase [Massilia sp. DJPM01]|uniref:AAA family ATPase n=1 Tax=Massilia sp. DJPM01 TaxID=3024404 RepID=UPI00259E9A37|nr:AAA family ATPase [Massilia sp. DJPM01]MDM5180806.1 AAA family ATPase [Massilia sp. DJPM01]
MHINFVEIRNFRRLAAVRIDLACNTTLFVGANNSGKTSGMTALRTFLIERNRSFSMNDLPVSTWRQFDKLGERLEAEGSSAATSFSWQGCLPSLDVWLQVEVEQLHRVSHLLPTLGWNKELIGVRLQLEPVEANELVQRYCAARVLAKDTTEQARKELKTAVDPDYTVQLWPASFSEFIAKNLNSLFKVKSYLLDPNKEKPPVSGVAQPQTLPSGLEGFSEEPFLGLIQIDEINAQRGFSDHTPPFSTAGSASTGQPTERRRLSEQLRTYYSKHLDPSERPEPSDVEALQAIHSAQTKFDDRLKHGFLGPIRELETLGYAGLSQPKINISTRIRPTDGLNHESAVTYEISSLEDVESKYSYNLPEQSNGLGYQNLISMAFRLIGFRDAWMRVGKAKNTEAAKEDDAPALIHLVLVEEPEAHLHAQVQQVFIRKASKILRNHPDLLESKSHITQLVVSTHSSHIAHETDFADMRYFRREPAAKMPGSVPTSSVINLSEVFGKKDNTAKFVSRYLKATHCDLFFADAAIFVEGAAERMLLPHFISGHFPNLDSCYITILEIGGSHAHRFQSLLEHLGLNTLMITDLDSAEPTGCHKKANPKRNFGLITGSSVIKTWLQPSGNIDSLLDLPEDKKVITKTATFSVRIAYQSPVDVVVKIPHSAKEALARTFEDALVLENIDRFKVLAGDNLIADFRRAINTSASLDQLTNSLFVILDKTKKKAEFALDILFSTDPSELKIPTYIHNGLDWLQALLILKQDEIVSVEVLSILESA